MIPQTLSVRLQREVAARCDPLANALYRSFSRPLDLSAADPIIVLGNQKTGSTAIAALLARSGRLSFRQDVPPAWTCEPALVRGDLSLAQFVQDQRYYFRKDVVKENALTFCLDQLRRLLPTARFVFTIREPVQNVRSILDRVGLPGRLRRLDRIDAPSPAWHRVLDIRWLGEDVDELIASLARRWVLTAEQVFPLRDGVQLIKYEDFCADKEASIRRLALRLGVAPDQSIRSIKDEPFQPKGDHREVHPERFFGREALDVIQDICAPMRSALGYP